MKAFVEPNNRSSYLLDEVPAQTVQAAAPADWPTISVVTPTLNQAPYLEAALRSVHDQGYPRLEHVVIDGGSTDGSLRILESWAPRLSYWSSGPDGGLYHALDRGFARTTGEVMGWLNSDDLHTPWTLAVVGDLFNRFPQIEWLTTMYPLTWDDGGRAVQAGFAGAYSARSFWGGRNLPGRGWFATSFIQQESTFWRRSLWERAGARLDSSLELAGDFELWCRFFRHAELYGVATPLAGFRRHSNQKTARQYSAYLDEAERVLRRAGGRPCGPLESTARRTLFRALGGRSLRRLPPVVSGPLASLGLLRPAPACYWSGGWRIEAEFVI